MALSVAIQALLKEWCNPTIKIIENKDLIIIINDFKFDVSIVIVIGRNNAIS